MRGFYGILLLMLMVGCSKVNSLGPKEFQQQIGNTPNAVVIDVRTSQETYTNGIIPGANVSDYKSGEFREAINSLDKSKTYFLYCASGMRSSDAAKLMKHEGFENVYVLDGGAKAWKDAGLELQSR